jgi:hypothetical protein
LAQDERLSAVDKFVKKLKKLPDELIDRKYVPLYKEWTEKGTRSKLGTHLGEFVISKQMTSVWLSSFVICPKTKKVATNWVEFSDMTIREIVDGYGEYLNGINTNPAQDQLKKTA